MRKTLFFPVILAVTALTVSTAMYGADRWYRQHIFPNTYISTVAVGNLSVEAAKMRLHAAELPIPKTTVTLQASEAAIASSSDELALQPDIDSSVQQALSAGKASSAVPRWKNLISGIWKSCDISLDYKFSEDKLDKFISILGKKYNTPGGTPQATLPYSNTTASLAVENGTIGHKIDAAETKAALQAKAAQLAPNQESASNSVSIAATVKDEGIVLSPTEIEASRERTLQFVGSSVAVTAPTEPPTTFTVPDTTIVELLSFPEGYNIEAISKEIQNWQERIERQPQSAEFSYDEETLEVNSFLPHRDGVSLDIEAAAQSLRETLDTLQETDTKEVTLNTQISTVPPATSLTDTNDLGIKELVGFGESSYTGSIPNRIHNVAITTERISDTIIPPNAEFSFNETLGPVSAATGFKSAYVIRNGRTERGDGGGVCQVSTTVFRSLLDAGLDITLRLPHSYRVKYYEQNNRPGFDATVYSGDVDLRFKNDTGKHLLIHANTDSDKQYMTVEIYGTDDGRTTEISDYKQWGAAPPPPPQFIPSDAVPPGTRRQIDWAVAGLNTSFKHTVRDADGETMYEDTYTSRYRPWSAKYLVGE